MQFILVMAVVAALVIAENSPDQPVDDSYGRFAIAIASLAMVGLFAALGSRLIACRLQSDCRAWSGIRWFRHFRRVHAVIWLAAAGFVLYGLQWGQLVRHNWRLNHVFLLDDVLILAPVILPLVISWVAFYDVEQAIRLTVPNADVCANPLPGRGKYVVTLLRYYLGALLVPLFALLAIQETTEFLLPGAVRSDSLAWAVLIGSPLLALIALFPWLLRHVWETRPLELGPLRERLERTAQRAGFPVREILVWRTGGMVANAAVTGLFPGLRYVFLTDGLLTQLSDEQVEAVFGHEVGHVRHRHLVLRVLVMLLPLSLWILVEELWPDGAALMAVWLGNSAAGSQVHVGLAMLAVMAVYVFLVFGAYSRMLEGQADLFACRVMSRDSPLRSVETFVSALERLALIGGVDRNAASWQHASIAKRVEFLNRASEEPLYERVFQRRLRWFGSLLAGIVISPLAYRLVLG